MKPSWGCHDTLIYAIPNHPRSRVSRKADANRRLLVAHKAALVSKGKDVRFARLHAGNVGYQEDVPLPTALLLTWSFFSQPLTKTLERQRGCTSISKIQHVPFARLETPCEFGGFVELVDGTAPHEIHEKLVWELASCLFDRLGDDEREAVSGAGTGEYLDHRIRKDRLSLFWARLVQESARQQVQQAKSKEEAAIAYLSTHQVEEACGCLIEARDYRLATLVAMIGGDNVMRQDMKEQLNEWRRLRVLSEMSEPVRALYELLAGNTCVCEGSKGPLEDRARTFVLSDRFGLGWKQAFGMRLWYGIREEERLETAVQKYLEDLDTHREERARPLPWFVEQRTPMLWEDRRKGQREDLLWGLLKLYSDHAQTQAQFLLEDIIMPQNHQLSPMDFRLTWQLHQTLQVLQITDFRQPDKTGPDDDRQQPSGLRVAQLTLDFAWQLERAGHWTWAIFVVMHLPDSQARARAIQSLLWQHGGDIGEDDSDGTFVLLVTEYLIPLEWIWQAKALYARSVTQDHVAETRYLLRAGYWHAAHETLVQDVAPHAVIGDERTMLSDLLNGFDNVSDLKHWNTGGQVYLDYLRLLQLTTRDDAGGDDDESMMEVHEVVDDDHDESRQGRGFPAENDLTAVMTRLVAALPAMTRLDRRLGFYERIAVQEMSRVTAEVLISRRGEVLSSQGVSFFSFFFFFVNIWKPFPFPSLFFSAS